jgi:hypothetical protein
MEVIYSHDPLYIWNKDQTTLQLAYFWCRVEHAELTRLELIFLP